MNIEQAVEISDMVLYKYFNDCLFCSNRNDCETLEKVMEKTTELFDKFFKLELTKVDD